MDINKQTVPEFHTGDTVDLARHRASRTPIYKGVTVKAFGGSATIKSQSGATFTLAEGETVTLQVDRAPEVLSGEVRFILQ